MLIKHGFNKCSGINHITMEAVVDESPPQRDRVKDSTVLRGRAELARYAVTGRPGLRDLRPGIVHRQVPPVGP
eukprot:6313591-Lingulodinium_polyedra.AAC.1